MSRFLNWLASWRQTLQVAVYGPQVLGPRREPPHRIPTESDLADALGLYPRIELVSSDDVPVKAHTRKKAANPKREALHKALAGGAK